MCSDLIKTKFYYNRNFLPAPKPTSKKSKVKSLIGSTLGTGIALACIMKKQKVKNPLKVEYTLAEMCTLSASSIFGGAGASMLGSSKESRKNKIKEGIFQFSNATIPTWLAGASLKLCETSKHFNNAPSKILSTVGAILVGMHGAADLANKICDPKDIEPDRKLKMKDCIANIDDLFGILVLAKIPLLQKIPFDKALPLIYTYCGYKAGKTD